MSLVAYNKGVSSRSRTRLSKLNSEANIEDENDSDYELITRLKEKKIPIKLPTKTKAKLLQLDSDQAVGSRIDNRELKSLKMELASLKRNYKLIKVFGSFAGDLTVLTSEIFLIFFN